MSFSYRCPAFLKESLDAIEGDERFTMTVGCGAISAMLCALGFLTGGEYVTITLGTVGIFISAKGAENIAASNATSRTAIAAAPPSP